MTAALPVDVAELDGPEARSLLAAHNHSVDVDTRAILVSGAPQSIELALTVLRLLSLPPVRPVCRSNLWLLPLPLP